MRNIPTTREMHRAFMSRDKSYDGVFFTGVKTTGIFCRPSCPAKKPLKKNLEYFLSAQLDDAILGHGFESHSGFRDAFGKTFGTPPGRSRDQDCLLADWVETPLGPMVTAANRDGICLLEFSDRRMFETQFKTIQKRFGCAVVPGKNRHSRDLKKELKSYFAGRLEDFTVPLVMRGTPFQENVWKQLLKIPYGKTRSYEQVARAVGRPGAQRAVGTANGQNRMAILIPCHRVVNKSGALGGYGGGLWRKRRLLSLEKGELTLPGLGT